MVQFVVGSFPEDFGNGEIFFFFCLFGVEGVAGIGLRFGHIGYDQVLLGLSAFNAFFSCHNRLE